MQDFDKYKKLGEPEKAEKSTIWEVAIGLQQVDGLTPSAYLIDNARANIEGYITIDEVKSRLQSYYNIKAERNDSDDRTEEADKVSAHIAEILSEKTFTFSPTELISIHRRLFNGIYDFAGIIRDYNISKEEWVLNGDTVLYSGAHNILATLDYDFNQEKSFSYKGLNKRQKVENIADFISRIWQVHPFGEGNTRTTAVFAIKYLRYLGFEATNDLFYKHSWYFRNALVRANYNDYNLDIFATQKFLLKFFGNLLLGEHNELHNREMLISEHGDTVNKRHDTVNDTVNQAILNLIVADAHITAVMIANALNISLSTAKRHIKMLKEGKCIERVGSDKNGYWKVL